MSTTGMGMSELNENVPIVTWWKYHMGERHSPSGSEMEALKMSPAEGCLPLPQSPQLPLLLQAFVLNYTDV
jgi:hypothetical protein